MRQLYATHRALSGKARMFWRVGVALLVLGIGLGAGAGSAFTRNILAHAPFSGLRSLSSENQRISEVISSFFSVERARADVPSAGDGAGGGCGGCCGVGSQSCSGGTAGGDGGDGGGGDGGSGY